MSEHPVTSLLTKPVAVGDKFIETTPSGRQHVYTVTALDVPTRQGYRLPRATSPTNRHDVFITDELLDADWWQPVPSAASSSGAADPSAPGPVVESHGEVR